MKFLRQYTLALARRVEGYRIVPAMIGGKHGPSHDPAFFAPMEERDHVRLARDPARLVAHMFLCVSQAQKEGWQGLALPTVHQFGRLWGMPAAAVMAGLNQLLRQNRLAMAHYGPRAGPHLYCYYPLPLLVDLLEPANDVGELNARADEGEVADIERARGTSGASRSTGTYGTSGTATVSQDTGSCVVLYMDHYRAASAS